MTTAKSTPILAARHIVRGDVHFARLEMAVWTAKNGPALPVPEARALSGACLEANRRFGTHLYWGDFL